MAIRVKTENISNLSSSPLNESPSSLEKTNLRGRDISSQIPLDDTPIAKISLAVGVNNGCSVSEINVKEIDPNNVEEYENVIKDVFIFSKEGQHSVLDKITEETPTETIKIAQEENKLVYVREDDHGKIQIEASPDIAEEIKNAEEIQCRSPKGTRIIPKSDFSVKILTSDELNNLNTAVKAYIIFVELFPHIKNANINEEKKEKPVDENTLNNLPKQEKKPHHKENVEKNEKDFNDYFFADLRDDIRKDLLKALINISKQNLYDKDNEKEMIDKIIRLREEWLRKDIIIVVIKVDDLKFNNEKSSILNQNLKKSINKIIKITLKNLNGEHMNIYLAGDGKVYIK